MCSLFRKTSDDNNNYYYRAVCKHNSPNLCKLCVQHCIELYYIFGTLVVLYNLWTLTLILVSFHQNRKLCEKEILCVCARVEPTLEMVTSRHDAIFFFVAVFSYKRIKLTIFCTKIMCGKKREGSLMKIVCNNNNNNNDNI